jgi:DNA-binding response OmpR family regulator
MSADTCPCCGRPNISANEAAIANAKLSHGEKTLFRAVARGRGETIPLDVLHDALWGQRSDGGPDCALNVIRKYASEIRKKLAPYGLGIESEFGVGYRLVTVPIEVAA